MSFEIRKKCSKAIKNSSENRMRVVGWANIASKW